MKHWKVVLLFAAVLAAILLALVFIHGTNHHAKGDNDKGRDCWAITDSHEHRHCATH